MAVSGGGGETAKEPSGWTIDVLKAYMERVIEDLEKRLEQRFTAQEKSTSKYEDEVEKWRANSNEWRQAMDDREERFVQVSTFTTRFNGIETRIDELNKKIDDLTRSRDLEAGRRLAQTAIGGLLIVGLTVALRFIG